MTYKERRQRRDWLSDLTKQLARQIRHAACVRARFVPHVNKMPLTRCDCIEITMAAFIGAVYVYTYEDCAVVTTGFGDEIRVGWESPTFFDEIVDPLYGMLVASSDKLRLWTQGELSRALYYR